MPRFIVAFREVKLLVFIFRVFPHLIMKTVRVHCNDFGPPRTRALQTRGTAVHRLQSAGQTPSTVVTALVLKDSLNTQSAVCFATFLTQWSVPSLFL